MLMHGELLLGQSASMYCSRSAGTCQVVSSLMAAACVMVFAVTSVSRSAALHFHFMAPLQVYEPFPL